MAPINIPGYGPFYITTDNVKQIVDNLESTESEIFKKQIALNEILFPDDIEAAKKEWEHTLKLYGSATAQHFYTTLSSFDQAKVRKRCEFLEHNNHKCVKLTLPDGKQVISYGMFEPISLLDTGYFATEEHETEIVNAIQENVIGGLDDRFDLPQHTLKAEVLSALNIPDPITSGSVTEWKEIFSLFADIETPGNDSMQVTRQLLGITWHFRTNELTPSKSTTISYELTMKNCQSVHAQSFALHSLVGLQYL